MNINSKGHKIRQHRDKYYVLKMLVLLGVAVSVSCFLFYPFGYATTNLISSHHPMEDFELNKVLEKAAMGKKTVIITTLNSAWARQGSILDLFIESFRIGNQTLILLKHLVVVALDRNAYARCLQLGLNCYALPTYGVDFSWQANFMTEDYLKIMWRRIDFLRIVLEKGFDFIFTDADILWFRDPFPRFYPDADFQIACDVYLENSTDLSNTPNGGFAYVKSNIKTIQFYKFWYESRITIPEKHDQYVLNKIKYDPFIQKIGLNIRFLDTSYFSGICVPSKDINLVCTMHANCCEGLDNKIHDLKVILKDWKKYVTSPVDMTASQLSSWGMPQRCL